MMTNELWIHLTRSLSNHYQVVDDYLNFLAVQKSFILPHGGGEWHYASFLIPADLVDEEVMSAENLRRIPGCWDSNGNVVVK